MTPQERWIHRAIFADGRIQDSKSYVMRPGGVGFCAAGITQFFMRRRHPGVRVVHLISIDGSEWTER